MSCLGGTWGQPEDWVRFRGGVPATGETITGRVCDQTIMPDDRTRPKMCHGCPAYRGRLPDGGVQWILNPDDSLNSLKLTEYEQYVKWIEEEFEPEQFYAWLDGGVKGWTEERQAEYMRQWRAKHPGYDKRNNRKRFRAAYMRNYRAQRLSRTEDRV
jgi:hypothetical protein